ncbi:MAG: Polyketide cyclase / dehydrase and lipid transport, partial [Bryobacterales bacterium]|nr:Polyketide cyclase / dehydrase and lipid transport [Bryobacterales bacterium]
MARALRRTRVWVFRPTTGLLAAALGALTGMVAVCSLLAIGLEGLGCIVMTLPLAVPLSALGSCLVYLAEPSKLARHGGAAMMLLLLPPSSIVWDARAKPPVFEVHSAITIAAAPERVCKHVVTFSELPEPQEWFFRAGLAYPKRARIEDPAPARYDIASFPRARSWNQSKCGTSRGCCDSASPRIQRQCTSGVHTPRYCPGICMATSFPSRA